MSLHSLIVNSLLVFSKSSLFILFIATFQPSEMCMVHSRSLINTYLSNGFLIMSSACSTSHKVSDCGISFCVYWKKEKGKNKYLSSTCEHVLSHVQLFGTLRTIAVALQAFLSMEFPRQEYWEVLPVFLEENCLSWRRKGCHFLLQGISPTRGLNPGLLRLLDWQVDSLPLYHLGSPTCSKA